MNQLCCIFGKRVNASSYMMEISEARFCFVIVSVVFPAAEKKKEEWSVSLLVDASVFVPASP